MPNPPKNKRTKGINGEGGGKSFRQTECTLLKRFAFESLTQEERRMEEIFSSQRKVVTRRV